MQTSDCRLSETNFVNDVNYTHYTAVGSKILLGCLPTLSKLQISFDKVTIPPPKKNNLRLL